MSVTEEVMSAESVSMESLLASLKELEPADLFKLLKSAVSEAEKKSKQATKGTKKAGSAPKGVAPPQLAKPRAWVEYTLKHAIENGWEAFVIRQSKTDKDTKEKVEEEIEMLGSVQNEDGAYVYEDSITEKAPKGRQINHKEAMSLSKQRKDGGHESYAEFEATYVPEAVAEKPAKAVTKTVVVRKTAAEKLAEAEEKKAAKEAEKAEKKAAKEAERAEKKAAKEAEKAALKEAKEAEKALAKAAKEAEKAAKKSAPLVKGAAKPAAKPAAKAPAAPVKPAAKAPVAPVKPAAKKPDVVIPDDGAAHPWTFKGKKCLRTHANEVWEAKADGQLGKWLGLYDPAEDKIDDSADEPQFDEE
jgi:hypothetical protein